jgi:hypothetical protein
VCLCVCVCAYVCGRVWMCGESQLNGRLIFDCRLSCVEVGTRSRLEHHSIDSGWHIQQQPRRTSSSAAHIQFSGKFTEARGVVGVVSSTQQPTMEEAVTRSWSPVVSREDEREAAYRAAGREGAVCVSATDVA